LSLILKYFLIEKQIAPQLALQDINKTKDTPSLLSHGSCEIAGEGETIEVLSQN